MSAQRLSAASERAAQPEDGFELDAVNSILSWDSNSIPFRKQVWLPEASEFMQQLQQLTQSPDGCGRGEGPDNALPPITPYVIMRVGRVPVGPYTTGLTRRCDPHSRQGRQSRGNTSGDHGPVVAGTSLKAAVYALQSQVIRCGYIRPLR